MKKITLIIAILTLLFCGFTQNVWAVDFYHTVWGMRQAVEGRIGTAIWSDGDLIVLMWKQNAGYAFAVVNKNGKLVDDILKMANATGTSYKTAVEFIKFLEHNDFNRIYPNDLPNQFTNLLLSQFILSVISGSRSFITPIIVPIDIKIFEEKVS